MKGENKYGDIIGLPHHQSKVHPHMPVSDRAAQFAPFAALKGYEETIGEAGRWVDRKTELTEDAVKEIDAVLGELKRRTVGSPFVRVTFFQEDERKEGGFYLAVSDRVLKISEREKQLVLEEAGAVAFHDILSVVITDESAENGENPS